MGKILPEGEVQEYIDIADYAVGLFISDLSGDG